MPDADESIITENTVKFIEINKNRLGKGAAYEQNIDY